MAEPTVEELLAGIRSSLRVLAMLNTEVLQLLEDVQGRMRTVICQIEQEIQDAREAT